MLLGTGAVDARELPFAAEVSHVRASVQSWQEQQAHRGACYVRGMQALDSGDSIALDAVAADCR
jgi:hypothetical protein